MKTLKISLLKFAMGLAAVAIFLSAPVAHGARPKASRHKLPSFTRVLSYNEVMRLPKVKRQAYIRGLRAMMKEIDRLPKKMRVSNESSQYSQIATLLSLFAVDEAFAADAGMPVKTAQGLKCGSGYTTRMVVKQVAGTSIEARAVCVVGGRQDKKCGSSLIGINAQPDGTWECATQKSFVALPDQQKAKLRRVPEAGEFLLKPFLGIGGPRKNFINGLTTAEQYEERIAASKRPGLKIVLVDPNEMPARLPDPVQARLIAERDARRAADARLAASRARGAVAPAEAPATAAGNAEAGGAATASGTGTAGPVAALPRERTNYQAVDNDGSGAILVTPVTPREELAGGPEASDEEEGASTQAGVQFGSCEPEAEKTCDEGEIERARQQYASDPDPDCIYAGSISAYQDGKKRAYKCVAPSQFCFGSSTCAREDGERMTPDYSCETNQVICNPLIFGVQSDGKSPFCIEKGASATATCDETSKADEGAVTPLDQEHAGLKEAWNDFSDHLFKMCNTNKIAAALHCAECDIITKRLFALNIAARSVESCGAAIKFEDSQCDADGKCQGLPGQQGGGSSSSSGARRVSDTGSKRFEVRGNREISSVPNENSVEEPKANVHSMSDVKPKPTVIDSVFNTPSPRPK